MDSVRQDMLELNKIILDSLDGIKRQTLSPHTWALGTGSLFQGDLEHFYFLDNDNSIVVTHGDVVDDAEKKFGILSGDDIAVRLVMEASPDQFKAVHMIFAMTGVYSYP